jgi:hypothetical protein
MLMLGLFPCSCGGHERSGEPATSTSAAAAQPTGEPTPSEPTPIEPYIPTTALAPIALGAHSFECPALPSAATGPSAEIARVLRRLACEPELFTLGVDDLPSTLELPAGTSVHFSSASAIVVEIADMPPTLELAAALGIDKPVARLQWNAYHDQWWLGSNPDTGALDRYGPGVINIRVEHEAVESDPPGKLVPITEEMVASGYVMVAMPEGMITLAPDPDGLIQLTTAMRILAATPAMLAEDPQAVAKRLGMVSERFRVDRTSLYGSGEKVDGISIDPARTVIPADELAKALGLVDARAVNVNREHDVWKIEAGSSTQLQWNGLVVDIDIEVVDDSEKTTSLAGATVEFITMLPASQPK